MEEERSAIADVNATSDRDVQNSGHSESLKRLLSNPKAAQTIMMQAELAPAGKHLHK